MKSTPKAGGFAKPSEHVLDATVSKTGHMCDEHDDYNCIYYSTKYVFPIVQLLNINSETGTKYLWIQRLLMLQI